MIQSIIFSDPEVQNTHEGNKLAQIRAKSRFMDGRRHAKTCTVDYEENGHMCRLRPTRRPIIREFCLGDEIGSTTFEVWSVQEGQTKRFLVAEVSDMPVRGSRCVFTGRTFNVVVIQIILNIQSTYF